MPEPDQPQPRSLPTWRIFLSSTAVDLVAHRAAVADAILRLGNLPVRMETFGALPNTPVIECERLIRESDAVVAIVAHRYGWAPSPEQGGRDGKSITWLEVEAALGAGRPVFVFIVDETHPWTTPKEQDRLQQPDVLADPAKVEEVIAAIRTLQRFKAWLRSTAGLVVATFTTADDLAKNAATSLGNWALRRATSGGAYAAPQSSVRVPELRVCHALQPAPHFQGRTALVEDLCKWWSDPAHPDRVRALVAAGGTGKTAIIEQVLLRARGSEQRGHTLVWSFYEAPDADAFLREACELFLGEREGAAGGRLERLERGLREGNRPHVLVLDGLERLQSEARESRARGEIEDHTLRLLLRAVAAGLGRARALVTSRLQLTDLDHWKRAGYGETRLDDLEPLAAVALLRAWGVRGDDARLGALAAQAGNHALSVSVLGSYLADFGDGDPAFAERLQLQRQAGDDPQAARLARILQSYSEKLPAAERDLLVRLSVFPRGVSVALLGIVVGAGGEVAGELVHCDEAELSWLAKQLVARGLAFTYTRGGERTFTAHPFLRDWFRQLLGSRTVSVHEAIRSAMAPTLEARPERMPTETELLDRYETLIEHTRLAGREQEAAYIYGFALGGYAHLALSLGENVRLVRILSGFSASGRPEDIAPTLPLRERGVVLNDWALSLANLGHLERAAQLWALDEDWSQSLHEPNELAASWANAAELAQLRGRLYEARDRASGALKHATDDKAIRTNLFAQRAAAQHALGAIAESRADFDAAAHLEGQPLYSLRVFTKHNTAWISEQRRRRGFRPKQIWRPARTKAGTAQSRDAMPCWLVWPCGNHSRKARSTLAQCGPGQPRAVIWRWSSKATGSLPISPAGAATSPALATRP